MSEDRKTVAVLKKGESIIQRGIDWATGEFVVVVQRNDGAITEERVSLPQPPPLRGVVVNED